jgi:mannose-1-phosphate guanylyltransferase
MAGSQTIYVFETAEPWVQITTASSALPANQLCLKQLAKSNPELMAKTQEGGYEVSGEVFVHPTATIDPSAKIGPNVFIGANVTVGKGSRVRDSLILDNTQIKDNSCVIHSIIGWDGRVGSWCRIEGSAPTNGSYDNVTKHGIKIQSTTVLGRDVSIRDETIIRNCMVLPHKELKDNFHNEILM